MEAHVFHYHQRLSQGDDVNVSKASFTLGTEKHVSDVSSDLSLAANLVGVRERKNITAAYQGCRAPISYFPAIFVKSIVASTSDPVHAAWVMMFLSLLRVLLLLNAVQKCFVVRLGLHLEPMNISLEKQDDTRPPPASTTYGSESGALR
jgi:hypothetical protein